jgi:hypothetical protein
MLSCRCPVRVFSRVPQLNLSSTYPVIRPTQTRLYAPILRQQHPDAEPVFGEGHRSSPGLCRRTKRGSISILCGSAASQVSSDHRLSEPAGFCLDYCTWCLRSPPILGDYIQSIRASQPESARDWVECATTFRGGKQARRVFEFIALGPTGMG